MKIRQPSIRYMPKRKEIINHHMPNQKSKIKYSNYAYLENNLKEYRWTFFVLEILSITFVVFLVLAIGLIIGHLFF